MPMTLLPRLPSITSVADRTIWRRSLDDVSTPVFSTTGIGDIASSAAGAPATATGTVGTDTFSGGEVMTGNEVISSPPGDTPGVDASCTRALSGETFDDLERFLTDFFAMCKMVSQIL